MRPVAAFIFDLDGTLVDTDLDFASLRRDIGLPEGLPILEALAAMDPADAGRCREILDRHEQAGAERAVAFPGVSDFLLRLDSLGLRRAVLTRNSRAAADRALVRAGLRFEQIMTREDGPPKPDPWAVLQLCAGWDLEPERVVMVGDYQFDIEAGRQAGARTVLYTRGRSAEGLPGADQADFTLDCFRGADALLRLLGH